MQIVEKVCTTISKIAYITLAAVSNLDFLDIIDYQ